MPYQLVHESGETTLVHDGHVLGAESPLKFAGGCVTVESEDVARNLARRHSVVEYEHVPDESESDSESANGTGDEPTYSEMDYAELRQLAADADTDAVNGRSSKDDIIAHFSED